MQTQKTLMMLFSVVFLLILLPAHVAAQESFKGNSGEPFAPSTIIIIIMAIIFLFTGCLAVFLRRYSHGCFGLHVIPIDHPDFTSDGQLKTKGLDADVIKSLPTYFYADVKQHRKSHQVELECAVCLVEFKDPEALRLLPGCSHVFHPHCIDQWLAAHVTCPICRQSLEPSPPHTIINIISPATATPHQNNNNDQSNNTGNNEHAPPPRQHADHDDREEMIHEGVKRMIVGKFPRSHSTGHSIKRHTLVLPEEVLVQNNIVNRTKGLRLGGMVSPTSGYKCGWFSMTPPVTLANSRTKSLLSSGLIKSISSKNLTLPQHQLKTTSDRF